MNKIYLTIFFLSVIGFISGQNKAIVLQISKAEFVRIEPCSPAVFRIRINQTGNFRESLMERYGIVKKDWAAFDYKTKTKNSVTTVSSDSVTISIDKKSGTLTWAAKGATDQKHSIRFSINNPKNRQTDFTKSLTSFFGTEKHSDFINGDSGTAVITERNVFEPFENPGILEFSLNKTEHFYGLGNAVRDRIQQRGNAAKIWVKYQRSEAPIPFIMSNEGWGVFYNSTQMHYFDVGRFDSDKMTVYSPDEELDFYLMAGTMPEILNEYTTITGKPFVLPKYAYGFAFGSNNNEDQFDVMNNALRFREDKFPCDVYWLEPQWMAGSKNFHYDYTTKKKWNYEKFRPDWPEFQGWEKPEDVKKHLFVYRLNEMGFKMPLWICVEEDLSVPEEIRIARKEGKSLTRQTDWFTHLTGFMNDGVCGFKIDPSRTIEEHPNRKYYNGLADNEMHLIQQVLVVKNANLTCSEFNNKRPFLHYCGGYAGTQHWAAMTSGDNGGGRKALFDQLNLGTSGIMNTSCDILEQVFPMSSGLHFGFLLPWVQLNSWAFIHHPWYYSNTEKAMFRFYDNLRYSLIPYIYSTALNGSLTGMPILRAMPLMYPDDTALSNNTLQYMLGDNLLVTAFTNKTYLPEGNWIDYWTGKHYAGKQEITLDIPANRGGLLFIKAGAIIPYQNPMQYVDEFPADTLILKIYPSGESKYTLYEDDGISYKYESGAIAKTEITCKSDGKTVQLSVSKRHGKYDGMPLHRVYQVELYGEKPVEILVNNVVLKSDSMVEDVISKVVKFTMAVE